MFNYISGVPEGRGKSPRTLFDEFKEKTVHIVRNSLKSVKGKIKQQNYTFELMGYDFLLDEDLNNILIEANTNPCLEESNELLRRLLPRMIDDLLNITVDPVFNSDCRRTSVFKLPGSTFGNGHDGYPDNENLFEYIHTLE